MVGDKYIVVLFKFKKTPMFVELDDKQRDKLAMSLVKSCFESQAWEGIECKVMEKELD